MKMKILLMTWISFLLVSVGAYVQQSYGYTDQEVSAKVIIFGLAGTVVTLAGYVAFLVMENRKASERSNEKYQSDVNDMHSKHAEKIERLLERSHDVINSHRDAIIQNAEAQKENARMQKENNAQILKLLDTWGKSVQK